MIEVKFSPWHNGFLAARNGKLIRRKEGRSVKVFRTEAAALKAIKKSTMGNACGCGKYNSWK